LVMLPHPLDTTQRKRVAAAWSAPVIIRWFVPVPLAVAALPVGGGSEPSDKSSHTLLPEGDISICQWKTRMPVPAAVTLNTAVPYGHAACGAGGVVIEGAVQAPW